MDVEKLDRALRPCSSHVLLCCCCCCCYCYLSLLCSAVLTPQPVTILQSFLPLVDSTHYELQELAYFLCTRLRQESVLISMAGKPALLRPRPRLNPLLQLWIGHTVR